MSPIASSEHPGGAAPGLRRVWRPGRPVSVGAILAAFRRGGGDPTFQADRGQGWWLGLPTPQGAATLQLQARAADAEIEAHAWGPGAAWVLDQVPSLLGSDDDAAGFVAHHPRVAQAKVR